jgi:hypothetical protein
MIIRAWMVSTEEKNAAHYIHYIWFRYLAAVVDESYTYKSRCYYYLIAAAVAAVTFVAAVVVDVVLDDFLLCSIGTSVVRRRMLSALALYTIFQKHE